MAGRGAITKRVYVRGGEPIAKAGTASGAGVFIAAFEAHGGHFTLSATTTGAWQDAAGQAGLVAVEGTNDPAGLTGWSAIRMENSNGQSTTAMRGGGSFSAVVTTRWLRVNCLIFKAGTFAANLVVFPLPRQNFRQNIKDVNGVASLQITPGTGRAHHIQPTPLVGGNFDNDAPDPEIWEITATGSGAIDETGGRLRLSTGTTADSTIRVQSKRNANFLAGAANQFLGLVATDNVGNANCIKRWGIFDDDSGVFFEQYHDGTTGQLRLRTRKDGVDTTQLLNGVNNIVNNGFGIPVYSLWELTYDPLFVQAQQSGILAALVSGLQPIFSKFDLPIRFEVINSGGSTTNNTLFIQNAQVFRLGPPQTIRADGTFRADDPLLATAAIVHGRRVDETFDQVPLPEHDRDVENEQPIDLTNEDPVVFTADDTADTIESVAHGLAARDCVHFTTDGTLPTPLAADTHYFVVNPTADDFQVALTRGGTPIDITDTGTGTHSYSLADEFTGDLWRRISDVDHIEILYASTTPMAIVEKLWSGNGVDELDRVITDGILDSTTTITSAAGSFTRYDRGARVTGTGIPANTYIRQYIDKNTVILTNAATVTASGVELTIESLLEPTTLTPVEQNGYFVYYDIGQGLNIAPYYKFHVVNGAQDQGAFPFFIDIKWLVKTPYGGAYTTIDAVLNNLSRFLLTRSVVMAQQPDGDPVNERASGMAFDISDEYVEFNDDLAGNEVFSSDWFDTDAWATMELLISSTVESATDGVLIEYTNDVQAAIPLVIAKEQFTYGPDDAAAGQLSRDLNTRGDGARITFTNGAQAASPFHLSVTLRKEPRVPSNTLGGNISRTSTAIMNRGAIFAENDADQIGLIKRGDNGGLRQSINEHEVDTPVKTLSDYDTGQLTANPDNPVQVPLPSFEDIKAISIANLASETRLWFGKTNNVTRLNGDVIFPGTKEHWELDGSKEVWVISDPSTGLTDNHLLDADTVDVNNGVTSPTNLFATDSAYATFNDESDSVEISGFDASGAATLDEIQSVLLKMRGKKSGSPATQTVQHQQTVVGSTAGAVSVVSASLAGGTKQLYIVSISRNATNNITSLDGAGLTFIPFVVNKTNGGRSLDVWYAVGDATTGAITASMSSSTNAHIAVSRFSGADQTTVVQASGFTTGTGTTVTGPSIAHTALGLGYMAVSHEAASVTPGATYTERSDDTENGTGANIDNLASETKDFTSSASEAATMTLASSVDWIAISLTILPAATVDPVITITNNQGATVAVFTLTSTSDADFQADLTADFPNLTSIDDVVLTIEATTLGDADALIDRIWLDFTEAEEGSSVRVSYKWLGED